MAQQDKDGKPGARRDRRRGGFRRAGDPTRPVLEAVAGRHGFAQPDVLLRWGEIVGEALASTCRPVRVSYRGDRGLGATLVVEAESARAPEVSHLAPRIIERVNQFYGYRAVARLRIQQRGAPGLAEGRIPFSADGQDAPTADDAARAAVLTDGVEDGGLRDALIRLGANVLARSRGRPSQ